MPNRITVMDSVLFAKGPVIRFFYENSVSLFLATYLRGSISGRYSHFPPTTHPPPSTTSYLFTLSFQLPIPTPTRWLLQRHRCNFLFAEVHFFLMLRT